MFPPEAFRPLLTEIAALLTARRIPFAITGGLVSAFYSEPRYTQDADLVIGREQLLAQLDECLAGFRNLSCMLSESEVRQAIVEGRMFQLLHTREMLKVDFYPRELVSGELGRAVPAEVFPGLTLPIIGRADLIVSKLVWISKGSHKSRRDVKQLMRRASPEEHSQVRVRAGDSGLLPLLDEVLAEPWEIE